MRIFGIDPGSIRTGYGCVDTDGSRCSLVTCGTIATPPRATFPQKLLTIHSGLAELLAGTRPDCIAIESLFHAKNVRSALRLGHARGVAVLAATQADLPVFEYSPAEVKCAVVGYGRAEKQQVQQMVALLLGLETSPSPHDAADAIAIALCHSQTLSPALAAADTAAARTPGASRPRSWRQYQPADPKA